MKPIRLVCSPCPCPLVLSECEIYRPSVENRYTILFLSFTIYLSPMEKSVRTSDMYVPSGIVKGMTSTEEKTSLGVASWGELTSNIGQESSLLSAHEARRERRMMHILVFLPFIVPLGFYSYWSPFHRETSSSFINFSRRRNYRYKKTLASHQKYKDSVSCRQHYNDMDSQYLVYNRLHLSHYCR